MLNLTDGPRSQNELEAVVGAQNIVILLSQLKSYFLNCYCKPYDSIYDICLDLLYDVSAYTK